MRLSQTWFWILIKIFVKIKYIEIKIHESKLSSWLEKELKASWQSKIVRPRLKRTNDQKQTQSTNRSMPKKDKRKRRQAKRAKSYANLDKSSTRRANRDKCSKQAKIPRPNMEHENILSMSITGRCLWKDHGWNLNRWLPNADESMRIVHNSHSGACFEFADSARAKIT